MEARFICAHETYRRIFAFDIDSREPDIQVLAVHLPSMQRVTYHSDQSLASITQNLGRHKTSLTEWLNYNRWNVVDGHHLNDLNFQSEFVWYLYGRA